MTLNLAPSNRFRSWREGAGLTLREVADLTGLSESMLSRVERGQRSLKPQVKARVARCLRVPISTLFEPPADVGPTEENRVAA